MKRLANLALALFLLFLSLGLSNGTLPAISYARPFASTEPSPSVKGAEVTLDPGQLQDGETPSPTIIDGISSLSAGNIVTFASPIVESPIPFSHIGIRYTATIPEGSSISWEIRGSIDGVDWTDWYPIEDDDDLPFGADGKLTTQVFGLRINGRPDLLRFAQIRATLTNAMSEESPSITSVDIAFIDPTAGPTTEQAAQASRPQGLNITPSAIAKPTIISRTGWGSPTGQSSPNWLPEYKAVTTMIIHHTDTTNSAIDWAAEVRAIWYYHAITNGWGDIGYNYLIDPNGYIYEGRAGGDDVIAGHALRYNNGSLGVAVLGNYGGTYPSGSSQNSLVNLLSWKADQRGINPTTMNTYFVDKSLPTIMGHRDAILTTCPGNGLYSLLPQIRQAVWDRIASQPASAQIVSATFEPTILASGYLLKLTATVRNNGGVTIQTQGPSPGYVYNEGDQFSSAEGEKFNRFRLGIDLDGRSQSADHPYRWGLGKDLAPGESTTVIGYIRLNSPKTTNYWAGLVREGIAWITDGTARTSVQVTQGDTNPPVVSVSVPSSTTKTWLVVRWTATDDSSGLAPGFDVDYSTDNVNWTAWLRSTSGMSGLFVDGKPGQRYYFRVKARDNAGNTGTSPSVSVQLGSDPTGLSKSWLPLLFNNSAGSW